MESWMHDGMGEQKATGEEQPSKEWGENVCSILCVANKGHVRVGSQAAATSRIVCMKASGS